MEKNKYAIRDLEGIYKKNNFDYVLHADVLLIRFN